MSEMVERVVAAILGTVRGLPGCDSDRCFCDTMDETLKCRYGLNLEQAARAAIEAMREPTEAMVEEGYSVEQESSRYPAGIWREMIDAALR